MRQQGKNASYLRESNRKTVLNIIRTQKVSRADLARMTGLTRPTISSIVEELILDGLVMDTGVEEIDRGRHPEILSLCSASRYAIGVDITRDSIHIGIVDITGETMESQALDMPDTPPVLTVLAVCRTIQALLSTHAIDKSAVLGIGLSLPGPVDAYTGTILNPPHMEAWHNFEIVRQFEQELGIATFVENRATAYALAEKLYDRGRDVDNYFLLLFEDGVGSANIVKGIPYRGARSLNAEFGHVSIDMHGPVCRCGNRGCLELYTSPPLLIKQVNESGIPARDWKDVVEMALSGNAICLKVIKSQAHHLAFAITNIINAFFPQDIILAGRIQYKSDLLMNFIHRELAEQALAKDIYMPKVIMSQLHGPTEVLAAASIILNQLFTE